MKRILAAAVCSALVAPAVFAADPTTQELLEQIRQLQTKVEQLESRQGRTHADADVAATVDQIIRDAEKRSKFLVDDGVAILAGHEREKFFIRSADNNYRIEPSFEFQLRNTTNFNSTGEDSVENGFEIRRMKVRLEGNAITPDLTYAFQWAVVSNTGTPRLEDAWARWRFAESLFLRGGQFKEPLAHEQQTSGRRQLAADRTLMAHILTGAAENYTQGITVIYDKADQPWRAEAGFTDGINNDNTNWRDFPVNATNFGVVGRVEYFARGDRRQYEDFTAIGNTKDLLVFGAGGDITQSGSDTQYLHTLDAAWENTRGVSLYAAYLARLITFDGGDVYDWGFMAQAAYLATPRWEPFVRYDFTVLDTAVAFPGGGSEDAFHEFTIGVNYYIQRHFAKFTIDASFLPNGSPSDQTGLGILGGDDAQFVLRAQFQLLL